MENQNIYAGAEQHQDGQSTSATHSSHKLQKQERRLLERLREAQEAEARALERFERAQAKLERRKSRIQRLEQRLSQLKEELTDLSADEDVPTFAGHAEQPVELLTDGYLSGEHALDGLFANAPGNTPAPIFEPSIATEIEEDVFEPEVHMTPELSPSPELSPENEPVQASMPSVDEHTIGSAEETPQVPGSDEAGSAEEIAPPPPASVQEELELDVEPDVQHVQSVQAVSLVSLEQSLMEAREVWQVVEASVVLAQNRRDELAKSISFLAQANLSGALMDELLHKQAEANRAWNDAKEQERIARDRLARAEAAYLDAQS